jgi:hypothetical protein
LGFNGSPPHEQLDGDLGVGLTRGDQVCHALLGGREGLPCFRRRGSDADASEFVSGDTARLPVATMCASYAKLVGNPRFESTVVKGLRL